MIAEIPAPDDGALRVMGNPIKFTGEPEAEATFPPALGGDTVAVLGTFLSLDADEVTRLAEEGVVGTEENSAAAGDR